jgi:IclR family acetate operon transcriptional repressor
MKPTAVEKALRVLDLLTEHPGGLRAADLKRKTGYPTGTLHRFLNTLVASGYAGRDTQAGGYVLGPKFLSGFSAIVRHLRLQEKAVPHLEKLAETTGMAANVGILRGEQVVLLESVVSHQVGAVFYFPIGTLLPPHCTGLGKVLLAHLTGQDIQNLQRFPLTPMTPKSITSADELADDLARVRQRGYATDIEESRLGIHCVAAPARDRTGKVITAVSVSAPTAQLPLARLDSVAALVVEAAEMISAELGYVRAAANATPVSSTKNRAYLGNEGERP